ncbi:LysR substrate-binding domain-containing protein [Photobacterium sp. J15]|uniref:LysR substrate-binding domain-containing protein n=1 Tax=Photobacterium sp. J15 TaxID=265901 RepID=UPI0007E4D625|nr:LysR substrate-binding domain-containing protein [Photobacterium sp. J15]
MDRKQALIANMHTFSVAAKFLSFTKAAEELCLTQGAVSQRIKKLEEQLGFKLFVRLTRRLELTPEGERMLATLNASFDRIFAEMEDIRFNELRGELYIGVAPTFGQAWLLPRLSKFQALYPSLNVKIRVKASRLDFQNEPVDLAIYYGDAHHSDFYCKRLFDEKLTPVCSPDYAEKLGLLHNSNGDEDSVLPELLQSKLSQACFIHCTESLDAISPNHEWQQWLEGVDVEIDTSQQQYVFNHAEMAISAARQSMGIAMGRYELVRHYIEQGELVAPFKAINTGLGYDLICPKGLEKRPRFEAFANWIQSLLVG